MKSAITFEQKLTAAWRKRVFNQDLFYFETVDALLVIGEEGTKRVSIENSAFRTMEEWHSTANRYCIDLGQNWYLEGVMEKVRKVALELGRR